jgi:ABC-2 type transport system ATP-binding protein
MIQDFRVFCNDGLLGRIDGSADHARMYAIELENVTKDFGDHHAVADLSLRVPSGSIFGFIGPNGSGKSTTLRMIMHIIHADRGRISVLGEETHSAANDRIGYLPEERGLYRQMKVVDLLKFFSQLKGHTVSRGEINNWLERVGLTEWAGRKVEALSKGMSQKVQFLATIIAKPQLLILDEPFSGLDPVNAEVVREIMLEQVRGGTTVLFSTHDMLAAESLCDQILMIYNGQKVLDGTLRQIQTDHGGDMVRIRLDWPAGSNRQLEDIPGVTHITDLGNFQELHLSSGADRNAILTQLMQRGNVEHFEITRPSLKDIFLQIAKGGAA